MSRDRVTTFSSGSVLMLMTMMLSPGADALQNERTEATTPQEPLFGFATVCELEVVQFYCHIAPHDPFCARGQHKTCASLKSRCRGFRKIGCNKQHDCCRCAFSSCPLLPEGCELIGKKCGGRLNNMDDNGFSSFVEIAKIEGLVKPGKVPIRINGPRIGSPVSKSKASITSSS